MAFWNRCDRCGKRGAYKGPHAHYAAGSRRRSRFCGQCWSEVVRDFWDRGPERDRAT